MIRIEQLLREWIGLEPDSVGPTLIHRAARLRMKKAGVNDVAKYDELLRRSAEERNKLLEAVVVTETWFFRDPEAFTTFAGLAVGLRAESPGRLVRLLSIPCSSGEEPYSMAMALLDAGLRKDSFQVDATDISLQALTRAKEGVYGKNSFRGKNLDFRQRYFQGHKQGFILKEEVRRLVHFFQANLLADPFSSRSGPYDFIFCRNLLIYLDRCAQEKALEQIAKVLAPGGMLFVGAAELALVLDRGFISANLPMAFACRKPNGNATLHQGQVEWAAKVSPNLAPSRSKEPPPASRPTSNEPFTANEQLDRARRLADAGQLDQASVICRNHLRDNGASAQAYYLLGLVHDAAGHSDAILYYRKALYLEPNHYETLLQLALLSEKNGDAAQARIFKSRAKRLKRPEAQMTKDE